MKHLDKFLMVLLIVGVWALVLKPTNITAQSRYANIAQCTVRGTAYGDVKGNQAVLYDWSGVGVRCRYF